MIVLLALGACTDPADDVGASGGGKADGPSCDARTRETLSGTIAQARVVRACSVTVLGPLDVAPGATLTLLPNTQLQFDGPDARLTVRGALVATAVTTAAYAGTETTIELAGDGSVLDSVTLADGIALVVTSSHNRLHDLRTRDRARFRDHVVLTFVGGTDNVVDGLTLPLEHAPGGVHVAGGEVEIRHAEIWQRFRGTEGTTAGITVTYRGLLTLRTSVVGNFDEGIHSGGGFVVMERSAIVDNGVGIATTSEPGPLSPVVCQFQTLRCSLYTVGPMPIPGADSPFVPCPIIRDSLIAQNDHNGLVLGGYELLQVERTVIEDNGGYGIVMLGNAIAATSFVRDSVIRRNNLRFATTSSDPAPTREKAQVVSAHMSGTFPLADNYWGVPRDAWQATFSLPTWLAAQVELTGDPVIESVSAFTEPCPNRPGCTCGVVCSHPADGKFALTPARTAPPVSFDPLALGLATTALSVLAPTLVPWTGAGCANAPTCSALAGCRVCIAHAGAVTTLACSSAFEHDDCYLPR